MVTKTKKNPIPKKNHKKIAHLGDFFTPIKTYHTHVDLLTMGGRGCIVGYEPGYGLN